MTSSHSSYQSDERSRASSSVPQHADALFVEQDGDDDEIPSNKRLTPLDAAIHLVKGNLGPGCLNLPHAFALSGWALGSGLFVLIALQGIYSMTLLVYCKNLLMASGSSSLPIRPHHHHLTFMDVAEATLGPTGGHLVEVFLFVLQGGVCCVFLSLIRTNLRAFFPWLSDILSVLVVTVGLMGMVLLRFLKDLLWLSATANIIMVIAILTAAIAGLMHFSPGDADIVVANPTPAVICTFSSDMFFAFEGIGLVLPVENSYYSQQYSFSDILVASMTLVALLFVLIGVSASLGFPNVHSGSITAYLEQQYPDIVWFSIVNALVILAVALTFPLQLTPAMQVLDEWIDRECVCCRNMHRSDQASDAGSSIEVTSYSVAQQHVEEETFQEEEELPTSISPLDRTVCCCIKVWVFRRWLMVLGCAFIVYWVDNLGLLIMAVGAIGQTGLAGMPCAIHLAMQYQGTAPRNHKQMLLDAGVLLICGIVMVSGLVTSITEMVKQ